MSATPPTGTSLRVSTLSQTGPTEFSLRPEAAELSDLAAALGVDGLRKLSFTGQLKPQGNADWQLKARLGATVIQPCVVTLEPVTTRIDTEVVRIFVQDYSETDAPEIEMPEDDSIEPLGIWIDPAIVMEESLALAVPEYPRKEGAAAETVRVTEPGKTPMSDEEARPFAGLAALKEQLSNDDGE
ncbi:YceD family protein [Sulfitobacter donghicola]|uniref:50S ribosomal protein L34 n=1 Tax=Sulfitobacter donghicola DSW-25 = KCTC 12864 = JCM 14565 TaxID=1300350 RepID=A0A073IJ34_9RHOB|nr:DUF177 domain-containing protein [Sulfitobacter donghicola]KEJ89565.1 hypothetical protein DSW25_11250 [Sulfitobacter donghicola DSW-25 = KCTC 12864 = JCM 14565]KIN69395.1 DUF177 domain containing protein [Sulfitobacter donghicola DSW-25 = KCTC 12864 = JCM 14565]